MWLRELCRTVCPDVFRDRGPSALTAVMFIFAMGPAPAALRSTFGATHNTYALLKSIVASWVLCCLGSVLLLLTIPTVVMDLGKQTL